MNREDDKTEFRDEPLFNISPVGFVPDGHISFPTSIHRIDYIETADPLLRRMVISSYIRVQF